MTPPPGPARASTVIGLGLAVAGVGCASSPPPASVGYDSITARGRIRGSVWGNAGSNKDNVEQLEDPDGTLRGTDELRALWATFGVGPERRVVFYCGTGWRASLALFHAWVMGWDRAALYDPGWFEWGADPANNPIDAGPPR